VYYSLIGNIKPLRPKSRNSTTCMEQWSEKVSFDTGITKENHYLAVTIRAAEQLQTVDSFILQQAVAASDGKSDYADQRIDLLGSSWWAPWTSRQSHS